MIPVISRPYPSQRGVPRASGDDPYSFAVDSALGECSPRERG